MGGGDSRGGEVGEDRRAVDALERIAVEAVGLTARALASVDPPRDLTVSQWRTLVVVDALGGARVGAIAARVGLSLPSTSRLIRRLERRGAVVTEPDPTDRRASIVRATPDGSAFRAAVAARRRELIVETLGDRLARSDPVVNAALDQIADAFEAFART
jgi:DNA-binding MarR family transcriptional regulator